jgi:imidazolonepropionase-like amidohydrolase
MSKYFLICGKFFDGRNMELKENMKILVENRHIQAAGEGLVCPPDAQVIDLSNLSVTPGIIDSHAHYEFIGNTFNNFAVNDSDEMKTLNLVYNCMTALQNGYTTIRCTGMAFRGFGCIDAKRAIDRGLFQGARLLLAPHALGTPGGHWDFSIFHADTHPWLSELLTQENAITSGADNFKNLVRKQVKYGADFIKIMAAGGFASPGDDPGEMQLDREEIAAIINTAHDLGKRVAAHAYTSNSIDLLISLGIDEIEHGTMMNERTAKAMEEHNIYLVPTLFSLIGDPDADKSTLPPRSPAYERKLKKYGGQLQESREVVLRLISDNKLTVGLGSDIVSVNQNTQGWLEFKAWRDLGIPALRALIAATGDNAKICGLTDIGILAPGKLADISAWSRDLLTDKYALSECSFVMKEGIVYKNIFGRPNLA